MNDENERKCALCGSPDFILANWPEASKPCGHLRSSATVRDSFEKIREAAIDVAIVAKILAMSQDGSPLPDVVFSNKGRRIL